MPVSTAAAPNHSSTAGESIVTMDRRRKSRRNEETETNAPTASSSRQPKQRRRHIDPTTCERDYSGQEVEFMKAMDKYKQSSGRMFPTCSEVLEVLRALGYVQLSDEQFEQLGLEEKSFSEEGSLSEEEADELAPA